MWRFKADVRWRNLNKKAIASLFRQHEREALMNRNEPAEELQASFLDVYLFAPIFGLQLSNIQEVFRIYRKLVAISAFLRHTAFADTAYHPLQL